MKRFLKNYDVIVLGAGAAGLMCAATAARRGRRVLVLEKANKVGKKILMSGGGRCNFTNYTIASENYISQNSHFCKAALSRYTQWDFIAMIERYGIAYEERKHGQLFCRDSAKDILAMLLSECEQTGVDIRSDCDVMTVDYLSRKGALESTGPGRDGELYQVTYYQGTGGGRRGVSLDCKSLVVATGALSIPTLGGSGFGYDIARQFGLPLVACRAGLVPFMFSDFMKTLCEKLSGLTVEVEVRCKDQAFTENLLFTHRGLSGPAIL